MFEAGKVGRFRFSPDAGDLIVFLDMDATGATPLYLDAARSLQLTPTLFSTRPWHYPEFPIANAMRMREMTLASVLAVIERLGRNRVAGIFTPRSVQVELAARVAQAIGRPHSDPAAIALCHNKLNTRRLLEARGLGDVRYCNLDIAEDAAAFAREVGGKVVVKPHTSSGAAGVQICATPQEARRHAETLLATNPSGALVEDFVDGPLFGVEAFHGKALGVRRLYVADHPSAYFIGQEAPAREPDDIHRALAAHAEKVLDLVGYTRGFAHVQTVYADGRPSLIEINPRVPAGMSAANINAGFGIDTAQLCLQYACGIADHPAISDAARPGRTAVTRNLMRTGGRPVRTIRGIEAASRVPHVIDVAVMPALFHRSGPVAGNSDRIATVHAVAPTAELATDSAAAALGKLNPVYESPWRNWLRQQPARLTRCARYGRAFDFH